MEIVFSRPVFLWFLLIIPVIIFFHFIILKYGYKSALKFSNFFAVQKVSKHVKPPKNMLQLLIRIITVALIISAVSGITVWYYGGSEEFDVVLAIDTSSSMLTDDMNPNRIEAAKSAAASFLQSLSGKAKAGIVSFSGSSFVEQRPTSNFKEAMASLNSVTIRPVGGTNIGDAVITSANLLLLEERPRIVVLLTDGQSNSGTPIEDAVNYANANRITVHAIGVGSEEGGKIEEIEGLLKLDEGQLRFITEGTGGRFYRADDQEDIKNAYNDIKNYAKNKVSLDLTVYLMIFALIFSFIEWTVTNTLYKRIP